MYWKVKIVTESAALKGQHKSEGWAGWLGQPPPQGRPWWACVGKIKDEGGKSNTSCSHCRVWLLALVILPARSNIYMRLGLVLYLSRLSIWILPKHVCMDQLGRVAFLQESYSSCWDLARMEYLRLSNYELLPHLWLDCQVFLHPWEVILIRSWR